MQQFLRQYLSSRSEVARVAYVQLGTFDKNDLAVCRTNEQLLLDIFNWGMFNLKMFEMKKSRFINDEKDYCIS